MDKFKDMDDAALAAHFAAKKAEFDALVALDAPTVAQVEEAAALAAELDEVVAEQGARTEAATKAAEQFAALKNKTFGQESGEPGEGEETEEERQVREAEEARQAEEAERAAAEEGAAAEEAAAEKTAAAASKTRVVAALAGKTKRPEVPDTPEPSVSLVASADVPGFSAGQEIEGIEGLASAVVNRMKGFAPPNGDGKSVNLQKFGVAGIRVPTPDEFVIDRGTDDMEVLYRAANERRLEGESLTAAGGWCAPSETLYDLAADESLDGILSVPEVQVRRGGIRYTQGPQFSDFYAEAGFIQTEAQAIAGTTKPCYEVDCPTFQEVRLDAVGLCLRVPILTNAAYPELVQRFVSGTLIAHQHMVNANVIGRMVTLSGAARVVTGLGSTVSDSLEALELMADQRRQTQRLSFNRTMEVVVPFWVKGAFRSDLARRAGVAAEAISDNQITAHFSARNLSVSFVYDWQNLDLTVEEYPDTYDVLMYPAGTFVKGVSDVINLSAVYDAASLAVNTYTALFMEQGLLVAKMQYDSDLVTLPICNAGRTGASDLTCTVTP